MRAPARVLGALIVLALAGLSLMTPGVEAHPYHLQVANTVLSSPQELRANRWVAQSWMPPTAFLVSRFTLYLADIGPSDVVTVSLRANSGTSPGSTDLAVGSADGPATAGWLNIDVAPYVGVVPGQTYWIVAHSSGLSGEGYQWWDSGGNGAYPDGTARVSPDGTAWAALGTDFAFQIYGFQNPSFSFSVVASPVLGPGESIVFRVNFTNAGPGDAMAAWVNVTWPSQLAYGSDNASAIGGVRSGNGSFAFANVATGVYLFNITAAPPNGWPNGTVAVTRFTFEATDHNGVLATRSVQDVSTTFRNARLTLGLAWTPPSVNPGEFILGNITVENVGAELATSVTIEASVDPNASYDSSSAPGTYDILSRIVRWPLGSVAVGSRFQATWAVRTASGTPDRAVVATIARAMYDDKVGAAMPAVTKSASSQVRAPVIIPALALDRGSAERGDIVAATLYYNNTGTGVAGLVWANWSLSGYYQLVDVFPIVTLTVTAEGFSIAWANVGPGANALLARLRVVHGLEDGLAMNLHVSVDVQDGNGNPLPGRVVVATTKLQAPAVRLVLAAPEGRIDLGSDFALELTITNGGGANAIAWLNLSLPSGVTYVGDNGTWPFHVDGSRVTWSIANLPAGSTRVLSLRLHGGGPAMTASFRFAVNYTEGRGSPSANALSNSVSVELVAPAGSPAALWLSVAAAVGSIAVAVVFVARRRESKARVEDVFVVDNNGILLAHRSAGLIPYGDDDVLVGMFTTVQQFVKDAFARGSSDQMRSLQFGERTIMIERGSYHYVALVFQGRDRGQVARRLENVSQEIEQHYGVAFASWTGDLDAVRGIAQILAHAWDD